MTKITKEKIAAELPAIFDGILSRGRAELLGTTDAELERFWYFEWDDDRSVQYNTYKFFHYLDLYRYKCRQWEELHNGSECVVERVRDKYLMPKIIDFCKQIKAKDQS